MLVLKVIRANVGFAIGGPRLMFESTDMTASTAELPPPSGAAATRRAIWNTIRGSSGNLVEWYDVYVYTVFASYFEKQFFDEADENSTVYIYAIFAITFVMRPVGSWFFGRYADRRGRRAALTFSVSLMAACSMVVALVPGRASIGMAAPIILILARLVQGFATGGEYGTSATYMSEAATRERRGFFSSFQYVTLVGGHVLAQFTLLIVLTAFNDDQVHEFGWRIGFAIGGWPPSWCSGCAARWTSRSARKRWQQSGRARTREPARCAHS